MASQRSSDVRSRLSLPVEPQHPRLAHGLRAPGGSKYITPAGAARLRAELDELWRHERPLVTAAVAAAAAQGDRSENAEYTYGKRRLREIDRRVRFLRSRLEGMIDRRAAAERSPACLLRRPRHARDRGRPTAALSDRRAGRARHGQRLHQHGRAAGQASCWVERARRRGRAGARRRHAPSTPSSQIDYTEVVGQSASSS